MDRFEVQQAVVVAKLMPVMEAWLAGKVVQFCNQQMFEDWQDFKGDSPAFTDQNLAWRIKPVPRRWWLAIQPTGAVLIFESKAGLDCSRSVLDGAEKIEVVEQL
jgi:hypothetical protein